MTRRPLDVAILCGVWLAVWVSSASAMMREVPLSESIARAAAVVVAHVDAMQSHWTDDHTTIVTDVTFTVRESWRGSLAPQAPLVLTVLGGEVGEIGVRSEHQPQFRQGESVLLFLEETAGARFAVYGLEQGVCRLDRDTVYSPHGEVIPRATLAATVAHTVRTR